MEVTDELIRKFFDNKCSASEAEAVSHYLSKHPGRIDQLLGMEEWNESEHTAELPDDLSATMLQELRGKLSLSTIPVIWYKTKIVRQLAIASVFVFAVINIWLFSRPANHPPHRLVNESVRLKKTAPGNAPFYSAPSKELLSDTNNTVSAKKIWLADGSVVWLHPNSFIRYRKPFDNDKREIYLTGKAYFKVARVRSRPFIVYSGMVATTALGTSFMVSAKPGSGAVSVQLYSGKVVIKAINHLEGWTRDIYLWPGQKMVYNDELMAAFVSKIMPLKSSRTVKADSTSEDLVFNNTSITEVFNQLQSRYHTAIYYNQKDIEGLNFTGVVAKTDSLSVFLKLLVNMKGFNLKEEKGSYTIY